MKNMFRYMSLFFSMLFILSIASVSMATEPVKIAGSGGMITLVTELAEAYMKKHPDVVIQVKQKSIEAKGGIMGTYKGILDIGMAARNLKDSEKKFGLKVIEIARVATVVGVNAESVPIDGITSQQLCDIYRGKITNWSELGGPDAPIKVFTRPDPDSTKVSVRKGIPCFKNLKEADGVVVMPKSKDMFIALMKNSYSIGFTDSVAVLKSKGKIKALKLDGITPGPESVASGKWPIVKHFNLLLGKKRNKTIDDFIRFIKSPEGSKIIRKNNAVPVK